ncbi:DUF2125 domain-containing protein [Yoonia sp. 2307UL14-13]|uniref:DUF2125 domain-containing protein n=1 Tax=Yoonia sp. 2307UL14-13 TaxID=3126506 RepID=UPI0030A8F13C
MTYSTPLRSAVCIAALFVGGTAQADVTAAQVWDHWKTQMGLYGEDGISIGSEEVDGDTLTVSDLKATIDDGDIKVEASMGDLVFTEQGDGTVSVTMAESYPVILTNPDGGVITLDVTQSGMSMIVSGDPDAMNYEVSADSYGIAFRDMVDGDVTVTGDAELVANDFSGQYTASGEDLRDLSYDLKIASLDILVDFEIPGAAGEYVTGSGKLENMAMQADMTIPADLDFENPDDAFSKGMSMKGGYTIDSAAYVFDFNADGDQASGSASNGATVLDFNIDISEIAYSVEASDMSINLTASEMPFPVEIGLAKYGVAVEAPVGKTEEPEDFGMKIDLVDLTVNDMIWDLFDAGQVLPRDPATFQFDVSGKAKALFDLMDPDQASEIAQSDMPFELESLSLNDLRLAVAGALVTGSGEFTFDNSDLETFDGMPRPEGEAVVEVNGLNALLDNLVAMGLVPEDQIMGGRMMMGMFARSVGDDQLESKLEVNGEGHVLVNGQRMR